MELTKSFTFFASGTRTASAASTVFDLSGQREMVLVLRVTAASGTTPTLDVAVQTSEDGTNFSGFKTAKAFTQFTTTGSEALDITNFGKWVRVYATIGGTTPSFTFSVIGHGKASTY